MRARALLLWFVASWCTITSAADTVDALTDPQRWTITGTQAYPAQQIHDQLEDKADIWRRSFPSSSRADFLVHLQQVLLEGYRKDGFLEAQVTVQVASNDGERVVCTIRDGPRFHCGPIVVHGSSVATALVFALTHPLARTPFEEEEFQYARSLPSMSWKAGDIVRGGSSIDALRTWVIGFLIADGCSASDVQVTIETSANSQATLVVTVQHEIPARLLSDIEVVGAIRNQATDIIALAQVGVGQTIDGALLDRVRLNLWRSARFHTFEVTMAGDPQKTSRGRLRITVEEEPLAPILTDPLPKGAAVMLEARDWFHRWIAGTIPQDLLIHGTYPTGSFDIALRPDQHAFLSLSSQVRSAPPLVAGIDSSWTRIRWADGGSWNAQLCRMNLRLDLVAQARTVIAPLGWTLSPDVGVDVRPTPADSPLLCCGVIPPAALMEIAMKHPPQMRILDHGTELTWPGGRVLVGLLGETSLDWTIGPMTFSAHFGPAPAVVSAISPTGTTSEAQFLTTIASHLIPSLTALQIGVPDQRTWADGLAALSIIAATMHGDLYPGSGLDDYAETVFNPALSPQQRTLLGIFGIARFRRLEQLEGSFQWTTELMRLLMDHALVEPEPISTWQARLEHGPIGPIGCWVAASVLEAIHQPASAHALARLGEMRFSDRQADDDIDSLQPILPTLVALAKIFHRNSDEDGILKNNGLVNTDDLWALVDTLQSCDPVHPTIALKTWWRGAGRVQVIHALIACSNRTGMNLAP